MSCGTPVVTMQMSADAIDAKDGHDIMVGNSAEELAKKSLLLLEEKETYEKIAHAGRKLIENNYTWKMIAKKLEAVYADVVKK
jgi:glycosyltransferase involved in cell wall biosynthesis